MDPNIQVTGFRIRVLGVIRPSKHSDSGYECLEPWLDCGTDHPSDWMQSEIKPGIILEGRSGPPPFQVKD